MQPNPWLISGGVLSALASLLHIGCILGGPAWYRFFGAGERMAQMAGRGDWRATVVTLGIASVLAVWSAYAFSGAGLLPRLPLMRLALVLICGVYLLRGLVLLPLLVLKPALVTPFVVWSSVIVLIYGLVHAVGLWTAWPQLGPTR
jgi:hypothetical protein